MTERLTTVSPIADVIRARPLAVFTDIDGTLSPIVDNPDEAYVPAEIQNHLRSLMAEGVIVSMITGRSLDIARRIVGVPVRAYAASHGIDVWVDGESVRPSRVEAWERKARQALAELRAIEGVSGITIEDKEFGLAIHYRRSGDRASVRESILSAISESASASEFEVHEGRMLVELRPKLDISKGTAVTDLVERFDAKGIVCLGDDVTDIDMFEAVGEFRGGDRLGVSIAVRSEEADERVLGSADYWVEGVEGVQWLLGEIVSALPRQRS
ncbi:MAG: trehalose-phosphatase [Dehalococcoidia bacterium]